MPVYSVGGHADGQSICMIWIHHAYASCRRDRLHEELANDRGICSIGCCSRRFEGWLEEKRASLSRLAPSAKEGGTELWLLRTNQSSVPGSPYSIAPSLSAAEGARQLNIEHTIPCSHSISKAICERSMCAESSSSLISSRGVDSLCRMRGLGRHAKRGRG